MENVQSTRHSFRDVHALVVGLAREGTALTRFLVERGARVVVTDAKPAEALGDSLAALEGLPVTYALGGHPLELLDGVNVVFVSPGVPLEISLLEAARQRGLPLSSETRLFTRFCPAPVVGITGSSGKTTTTALVGEMLKAAGYRTWVGGNIGQPLVSHLAEIAPSDVVIMELSSFQLEFFRPVMGDWAEERIGRLLGQLLDPLGWSPPFAALLNVTPNHLDRHPTMAAYTAAKIQILAYQREGDVAVLNLDNRVTRALGQAIDSCPEVRKQRILWFSLEQEVEEGAFLRDRELIVRLAGQQEVVCRTEELKLRGQHNVANMLAACALAGAVVAQGERRLDVALSALCQASTSFEGVEHRLELVRERNGVRWYNDSIATTPERTVAALHAFSGEPIVLLAGGRDKHLPWGEMVAVTQDTARHLILFGEAAELIEQNMKAAGRGQLETNIHHAGTLERAVTLANQLARPGDAVLLSPGGTSFDAYADYEARGEHFRQLVRGLE